MGLQAGLYGWGKRVSQNGQEPHQREEGFLGWHTWLATVLPEEAGESVMKLLEMSGPPGTSKILSRAEAEQDFPVLHLLFLGFSKRLSAKMPFLERGAVANK